MKLVKVDLAMVEKVNGSYNVPYRAWLDNDTSVNGEIIIKDPYDMWRVLDILLTDVQYQLTRITLRERLENGINTMLEKGNIDVSYNPDI